MCAQLGHFTKAAERLAITQSALSQRIKNLEEELSASLFIRDRQGLRLTEAGETLLRYCQTRASLEEETLEQVKGGGNQGLKGEIRLGGYSTVMRSVILPSLSDLIGQNPSLKIQLHTRELKDLPPMLRRGEIDFMILDESLNRDDLVSHKLGEEQNILTWKKGYQGPDVFLDHDENDETTVRYFRRFGKKSKIQRRYFDEFYGIMDGVKMGLGKAIMPFHLAKHEKTLALDKEHPLINSVVLHYYRQDYYTRLHQAVVETLTNHCQKYL